MQQLESDLDVTQEKFMNANQRLEEKEKALQNAEGEVAALNRRVASLEEDLETSEERLLTATQKLDLAATAGDDSDLDRAEERADTGETKIIELEEELRVVGANLKSLEVSEEKANQREEHYKEQIKHLTAKLKQAE